MVNSPIMPSINKGMIIINGVSVPDPRVYGYSSENIFLDSGRNTLGFMILQIIRRNLKKLTLEWHLAGYVQEARDLSILAENLPKSFNVSFIHPSGERRTMTCYRGSFSCQMSSYWKEVNGKVERWEKIQFNLIEV